MNGPGNKTPADPFERITDWLPIVLIFAGIGLAQLNKDSRGIVLNAGVLCYGVLGTIFLLKKNYHKNISLKLVKFLIQPLMIVLAFVNFFVTSIFIFILMLILLDKVVLPTERFEPKDGQR